MKKLSIKTILVCDKTWKSGYKDFNNLKFDISMLLDYTTDNILEKINSLDENYNIILVGLKFDNNHQILNNIIESMDPFSLVVYSRDLDTWDFSQISDDVVLGFNIKHLNIDNRYSNIRDMYTKIINCFSENKIIDCKIINKKNVINLISEKENHLIKNNELLSYGSNKKRKSHRNKGKQIQNIQKTYTTDDYPKVLILCDVKGWAWWIKSHYLKKYLDKYYNLDIQCVLEKPSKFADKSYDLVFTYGHSYIKNLRRFNTNIKMAGVTAHRDMNIIKQKFQGIRWVHANSVLLYKEMKKEFPYVYYIPNGVDTELFKPLPLMKSKEIIFGHVGKLSNRKGQEKYLEPAVRKAGVKYFSHYNNYKTRLTHDQMPGIYSNFDIYMCSSSEDGTPCPALEAAASGRPIITNKIGNMPELVETYKTGILLDKLDVDLYVDAIKWCQNNPDKVRQMGQNIRKKIETEWTWELMAKNYLYMFDDILGIKRDLSFYANPAQFHIKGL